MQRRAVLHSFWDAEVVKSRRGAVREHAIHANKIHDIKFDCFKMS
jgi:hypothetical protein